MMTKEIVIDLEKLRLFLNVYYVVSDELFGLLCKSLSTVFVPKGEQTILEKHGKKKVYFVYEGVCAYYYYKKEKECVVNFVKDGEFAILSHCLFQHKSFELYFKALNDSVLLVLSYDDFSSMWNTHYEFTHLFYNVIETYLARIELYHYHSRYCTAKERISYFLEEPDSSFLLSHIPRYYIASYLGITPETFSSLLGQLSKGK